MTEVMLMADVKKLGKAGAIVKVAPGYARNMLLPQGLAAPVTEASRRRLAKLEAERAEARKARRAAAEKLAEKLVGVEVKVNAPTVDGVRLYGSVRARDILDVIQAQRQVELDRSQITLPDELKEIGTYDAKIELDEGVAVPFKVVIGEQAQTDAE
jgi:large subunit ribosomal protein L9